LATNTIKKDNISVWIQFHLVSINLLVTITKTTKLFLTGSIPSVENDSTKVGMESKRMNLNTKSSLLVDIKWVFIERTRN
jgi:hypothetical protein